MITNLHIKNIGIIDDIEIDLGKALNVLTGETGAGKSLIIGSLNIISGGRFSKEMIRKGETNSFVEVALYEPENENAIDGTIIISREINVNGKNMCKINGRMVTVNELKEFMRKIIEIHGQNDSQNLLDNKEHLKYLDNFIGKDIKSLKEKYKEQYVRYLEIKKELKPEETTIHILVNDFTEIAIENIKKLDKVKQDLEYASDMCTEVISIYTTMDIPQLSNDEYTKMLIDARNHVKTAYELREKAMDSAITLINTKNPKYIGKITEYLNLSDNYIANFKDRLTDLNQIIDEQ